MTPTERAREIDRQEFEAERTQLFERAAKYIEEKNAAEKARVAAVVIRGGEPIASQTLQRQAASVACHTANGMSKTVRDWAEYVGVSYTTMTSRIREYGIAKAIQMGLPGQNPRTAHPSRSTPVTVDGVTFTMPQWALHLGISYATLMHRVFKGRTHQEAVQMGGLQRGGNPSKQNRGVVSNLGGHEGTGGGSTAQESAEITFSEKAEKT